MPVLLEDKYRSILRCYGLLQEIDEENEMANRPLDWAADESDLEGVDDEDDAWVDAVVAAADAADATAADATDAPAADAPA